MGADIDLALTTLTFGDKNSGNSWYLDSIWSTCGSLWFDFTSTDSIPAEFIATDSTDSTDSTSTSCSIGQENGETDNSRLTSLAVLAESLSMTGKHVNKWLKDCSTLHSNWDLHNLAAKFITTFLIRSLLDNSFSDNSIPACKGNSEG